MSDSVKDRITAELQKVKSAGGPRAERVWKIVQDAFSQAASEVKAGSGEMQVIAKETFTAVVENLDQTRETPQMKNYWASLDAKLADRYGDRYARGKQRLETFKTWYATTRAQGETLGPNPLQQKQAEFEIKAGEAGTTLAQKEHQIRQQLKDFWFTSAAKL